MNDLELVRRARPDVDHLDTTTRAEIADRLFGTDIRTARPPAWPRRLLLIPAVVLVTVGLAVVADRSRTLAPADPGQPTATVGTPTTTTVEPTTASTLPGPTARFRPPVNYGTLQRAAMTAYITRCVTVAGFTDHGPPYQTDSEVAHHAASIKPGTYEAAYYGIGGSGGCTLEATATPVISATTRCWPAPVNTWSSSYGADLGSSTS